MLHKMITNALYISMLFQKREFPGCLVDIYSLPETDANIMSEHGSQFTKFYAHH